MIYIWENVVVRLSFWRTSVVRVCEDVLRRGSGALDQGQSACRRRRVSGNGSSKRKSYGGLIEGHEVKSKGFLFG